MACWQPPRPEDLTTATVIVSYFYYGLQNDVIGNRGSAGIDDAMNSIEDYWINEIVQGLSLVEHHQVITQLELTMDAVHHGTEEMIDSDFYAYLQTMFQYGIHWNGIVQILSNFMNMVRESANAGQTDRVIDIIYWCIDLFSQIPSGNTQSLNEWIADMGGWESILREASLLYSLSHGEELNKQLRPYHESPNELQQPRLESQPIANQNSCWMKTDEDIKPIPTIKHEPAEPHEFKFSDLHDEKNPKIKREHIQPPQPQEVRPKKTDIILEQCKCGANNVNRQSGRTWDSCPQCRCLRCLIGQCQYKPGQLHYTNLVRHMKTIHPEQEQLPRTRSAVSTRRTFLYVGANQCACGRPKDRSSTEPWKRCSCKQYWCLMPDCTYQTLYKQGLLLHIGGVHKTRRQTSSQEEDSRQPEPMQLTRWKARRDLPNNCCQCGASIDRNTSNTWDRCSKCRRFHCLTGECSFQTDRFVYLRAHKCRNHSDEPTLPSSLPITARAEILDPNHQPNKCVCGAAKDHQPNKAWNRCNNCGQFWCLIGDCQYMTLTSGTLRRHQSQPHKRTEDQQ